MEALYVYGLGGNESKSPGSNFFWRHGSPLRSRSRWSTAPRFCSWMSHRLAWEPVARGSVGRHILSFAKNTATAVV